MTTNDPSADSYVLRRRSSGRYLSLEAVSWLWVLPSEGPPRTVMSQSTAMEVYRRAMEVGYPRDDLQFLTEAEANNLDTPLPGVVARSRLKYTLIIGMSPGDLTANVQRALDTGGSLVGGPMVLVPSGPAHSGTLAQAMMVPVTAV